MTDETAPPAPTAPTAQTGPTLSEATLADGRHAEIPSAEAELGALREAIDRIDDELLALLERRAAVVQQVGDVKRARQMTAFHVPERERAIVERLERAHTAAKGAFPREAIRPVFREIMSACLSLERPLVVSFAGGEATPAHLAGRKQFGLSARYQPSGSMGEVFREVARGSVDYGIVPVEDSTAGMGWHALDRFVESDAPEVLVVGEILLDKSHALLARSQSLVGIERVHIQAETAGRCASALVELLPHATVVVEPTEAAAAAGARDDARAAAVAPAAAADLFDLLVVKDRLEPAAAETSRFLVLGREPARPTGRDGTSLLVGVDDWPGRLAQALQKLGTGGVNLRRITSRATSRGKLEDLFFIDVDGHRDEPRCRAAFDRLAADLPLFKVLGSYPRAERTENGDEGGSRS